MWERRMKNKFSRFYIMYAFPKYSNPILRSFMKLTRTDIDLINMVLRTHLKYICENHVFADSRENCFPESVL